MKANKTGDNGTVRSRAGILVKKGHDQFLASINTNKSWNSS